MSGADMSHDGKRMAFFRLNGKQIELVVTDLDGSNPLVLTQAVTSFSYRQPRWSPDDSTIAYLHNEETWADDIYIVPSAGGAPRALTRESTLMSGLTWLPDGSHLVYSSARGNTLLYLPTLHLWEVSKSGGESRQLTFGESGDESPDMDREGRLLVSRKHMEFDIWKFPVDGTPADNVSRGVRITSQTGQVQTPTLDPTDHEMAYLSDSGGHGNIWVQPLGGGAEAPDHFRKRSGHGDGSSQSGHRMESLLPLRAVEPREMLSGWIIILIHPDGSDLHRLIPTATWTTWSGDSKWLYYSEFPSMQNAGGTKLMKIPVDGGTPVVVRSDNARGPAPAPDGSALYYMVPLQNLNGSLDYELRVARPESGPSNLLARISGQRVPLWQGLHPVISKDGKGLVMPLADSLGTNIYVASTADGKLRQVTDFGQKRTFIVRRISWSSDGKFVFAAVGVGDADIVQMDGLLQ